MEDDEKENLFPWSSHVMHRPHAADVVPMPERAGRDTHQTPKNMRQSNYPRPRLLLALVGLLFPVAAQAQTEGDWATQQVWTAAFDVWNTLDSAAPARPKANRIQLFRIVPGFLSDPVGLDTDDPTDATPDNGPDWLQVSMGNYNPYFDIRRPGDPGTVGYYKLHSQVQVVDTGTTSVALALQAVTPAGFDQDGIQDGPTIVSPSLGLFHTLDDGTGFQGFVSKNMNLATSGVSGSLQRNVQYGVAVQRPVLDTGPNKIGSFYLFVEALGRYRYDATSTSSVNASASPAIWEMVPGVHWRMTENVWLSGGLLMPVNEQPTATHLWQLTCSFQF